MPPRDFVGSGNLWNSSVNEPRSAASIATSQSGSAASTFRLITSSPRSAAGQRTAKTSPLSCIYCNSYKGANLSGIDPATGEIVRLFHPRRDRWGEHFGWQGAVLLGHTPVGRATIAVLRINDTTAVALRRLFMRAGAFLLP